MEVVSHIKQIWDFNRDLLAIKIHAFTHTIFSVSLSYSPSLAFFLFPVETVYQTR